MPPPPTTFSSDAILRLLPSELLPLEYRAVASTSPLEEIGIPPPVPNINSQTIKTIERVHPEYRGFGYQMLLAAWRVRLCDDRLVFQRWFPELDYRAFGEMVMGIDPETQLESVRRTFRTVLDAALRNDVVGPWVEFQSRVGLRAEFLCVLGLSNDYQLTLLHSIGDRSLCDLRSIRAELRSDLTILCCAVHEAVFEGVELYRPSLFTKNRHLAVHWMLLRRTAMGRRIMGIMGWYPSLVEIRALDEAEIGMEVYQSLI